MNDLSHDRIGKIRFAEVKFTPGCVKTEIYGGNVRHVLLRCLVGSNADDRLASKKLNIYFKVCEIYISLNSYILQKYQPKIIKRIEGLLSRPALFSPT